MAKQSVDETRIKLHEMFSIPDGVSDLEYGDSGERIVMPQNPDAIEFEYDNDIDEQIDGEFEGYYDPAHELGTPQILEILSQEVRMSQAGDEVVDVIMSIEDIVGASDYEVRVTKV